MRKYLNEDNSGKWKLLFDFQLEDYGGAESEATSKYINVPDPFITEIVQIWTEISWGESHFITNHGPLKEFKRSGT